MQKTSSINHNLIIVCLFCSMGFSPLISAKMYKWVDAEGNTHYTQSPPPDGIKSNTIKAPGKVDTGSAQKKLSDNIEKADSYKEDRDKLAKEEAEKQADKELNSKNCEISRSNVTTLERSRINLKDDDGNIYRPSEEDRLKRLSEARESEREYCQ